MSLKISTKPEDRAAIKTALNEISESLSKIHTEKVQINEILGALEDKFDIPKKTLRKVAYLNHRQTVTEFETEATEVKELYKAILG